MKRLYALCFAGLLFASPLAAQTADTVKVPLPRPADTLRIVTSFRDSTRWHDSTRWRDSVRIRDSVVVPPATPSIAAITVTPATVSLKTGAKATFTAQGWVTGGTGPVAIPNLQWNATGGSITAAGVYTAGSAAGAFTVTARSGTIASSPAAVTVTGTVVTPPPTGSNAMYFNSAEAGCGTDGNVLLCDDFEDGDWYTKNCDQANASGGLAQVDGWCGTIYGPVTPAACGGQGWHSNCAASHGVANGGQGGVTMADHSLAKTSADVYARFYFKTNAGYKFSGEKVLDFNVHEAGYGGIDIGNLHFNCGASGTSTSATLQWQPAGPSPSGCRTITSVVAGSWYFVEVHVNTAANVLQVWADNCGPTGTTCPATPTLRLNLSNYTLLAQPVKSLWFENWANNGAGQGSSGTRLIDQIKVSTVGPIGFMP